MTKMDVGGIAMLFDFDEYEQKCDEIRKENQKYIDIFEKALIDDGLTDRTIGRHLMNIDFYINTYLLREELKTMDEGCYNVDMFLGFFFIRKCMWSTPASIKSNITSFKKFYKCMLENGFIKQSDYDALISDIAEGKDEWIQYCEEYNDPYCENPFMREFREFMGDDF